MKQYLAIVSNEKTTQKEENFFCDNIDMKSIPEGLKESSIRVERDGDRRIHLKKT